MRRKKNIYINEGSWERAKWIAKYKGTKEEIKVDLNDCICEVVEVWVKQEMDKIKDENPEMFRAIEVTASEKENAAEKLEDVFKKTKLKEVFKRK